MAQKTPTKNVAPAKSASSTPSSSSSATKEEKMLYASKKDKILQADAKVVEDFFDKIRQTATTVAYSGKNRGLQHVFKKYDSSGDGRLTQDEFKECLLHLGIECSNEVMSAIYRHFDGNKSGTVSSGEFMWAFFNRRELMKKFLDPVNTAGKLTYEKKLALFKACDKKGQFDGKLDRAELISYLKLVGLEGSQVEVDLLMHRFDKNKDGALNMSEFEDFLFDEIEGMKAGDPLSFQELTSPDKSYSCQQRSNNQDNMKKVSNADGSTTFSLTATSNEGGSVVDEYASIYNSPDAKDFDIEPSNFLSPKIKRYRVPPLKERYFGPKARSKFHDRTQFIAKQRNIGQYDSKQATSKLYFDNEDLEKRDFPFNPDSVADIDATAIVKTGLDLTPRSTMDSARSTGSAGSSPSGYDSEDWKTDWGDDKSIGSRSEMSSSGSSSKYSSKFEKQFPEPKKANCVSLSPRSKFISNCLKNNMNPRASLVLRKRLGKSIDLQHLTIGDKVALLLAECLGDMPYIEAVNVNDNNLTDVGVAAILRSAMKIPNLKLLNLSKNKMDDDASDTLAEFVQSPSCKLEVLVLQHADVDDFEGEVFIKTLSNNKTITDLDLSDNKIGTAENMRSIIKDLNTCSDAIATLLSNPVCNLKRLVLSWNTIRLLSSFRLATCLAVNNSLTYLDLSFNSFGVEGGEQLGDSLMENKTLQTLILTSNNINATSCFAICMGVIENYSLTKLVLDQNPIGEAGAHALMVIPMSIGGRVKISADKCNITLPDAKCWFSHSSPLGSHTMDLSKPYDRAVGFAILDIAANHSTIIVKTSTMEYPGSKGKQEQLPLVQTIVYFDESIFPENERKLLAGYRIICEAAGDLAKGKKLFEEGDADGGGSLDRDEIFDLLASLGLEVDEEKIEEIMTEYDLDGAGSIELPEFLAFLKSQYRVSKTRIADMTESRVMALATSPKVRYVPPREGVWRIELIDGFNKKESYSRVNSSDQEYANDVASGDSTMMAYAVQNTKLRLAEASSMFYAMYAEGAQPMNTLANLLVRIDDPGDARKLLQKVTRGDKTKINMLRNIMGCGMRPAIGIYNGFYILDLSKEMDRICLSRLLEHSETVNIIVRARQNAKFSEAFEPKHPDNIIGDVSQNGNWSCFRNACYNSRPFEITPDAFRPMPRSGKLTFDFSSIQRPVLDEEMVILTDHRLFKVLSNLHLLSPKDLLTCPGILQKWKKELKNVNINPGSSFFKNSKERAMLMSDNSDSFYKELLNRQSHLEQGSFKEAINVDFLAPKIKEKIQEIKDKEAKEGGLLTAPPPPTPMVVASVEVSSSSPTPQTRKKLNLKDEKAALETAAALEAKAKEDAEKEAAAKKLAANAPKQRPVVKKDPIITLTEMEKYQCLLEHPAVSNEAKSARVLDYLLDVLCATWLRCRHVALILYVWKMGKSYKSRIYGSYHVEFVVYLVPRIVDLYNFEVILKQLSPCDASALYCRIGWLYLFNPMKPEGFWDLTFTRYEERQVLKCLIGLSMVEPGDNWPYKSFRWNKEPGTVEVPAWDLTIGYTIDKSCTTKGYLCVDYYSGQGLKLKGCRPNLKVRKGLMQLCLIDELDSYDYENTPSELSDEPLNFASIAAVGVEDNNGNTNFDGDNHGKAGYVMGEGEEIVETRPSTADYSYENKKEEGTIDNTSQASQASQAASGDQVAPIAAGSESNNVQAPPAESKPIKAVSTVDDAADEELQLPPGSKPPRVGEVAIFRSIKVEMSISQWLLYYAPPDGSIRDIPGRDLTS